MEVGKVFMLISIGTLTLAGVDWPVYNSTEEGVVMTLQDQGNLTSAPGPDTMRQAVYVRLLMED